MRIPAVKLNRLGCDPELLFGEESDLSYIIHPAQTILATTKEKGTASFIGIDSRPILGEIRPGPFRNIKAGLYEFAFALNTIDTYLKDKFPKVRVLAYPFLHGESVGGHLHASFFIDDPFYVTLEKCGQTLSPDGTFIPQSGATTVPISTATLNQLVALQREHDVFLPHDWGHVVSYLIQPFEQWIQPWLPREQRNIHYGHAGTMDVVRTGTSPKPTRKMDESVPSWFRNSAYVHWEYRLPSTWLHHPTLAYVYLALLKLIMLNLSIVSKMYKSDPDTSSPKMIIFNGDTPFHQYTQLTKADNDTHSKTFLHRLGNLYRQKLVVTPDLRSLHAAIDHCGNYRERWFRNVNPIDLTEWRRLLP